MTHIPSADTCKSPSLSQSRHVWLLISICAFPYCAEWTRRCEKFSFNANTTCVKGLNPDYISLSRGSWCTSKGFCANLNGGAEREQGRGVIYAEVEEMMEGEGGWARGRQKTDSQYNLCRAQSGVCMKDLLVRRSGWSLGLLSTSTLRITFSWLPDFRSKVKH